MKGNCCSPWLFSFVTGCEFSVIF